MDYYKGEKVRLRPVSESDVSTTLIWRNDPEIRDSFLGYQFPVTKKMEEAWFERLQEGDVAGTVVFSIETLTEGQFIGLVNLHKIDWQSQYGYFGVQIGDKDYHGRGMGKDATRVMLDYAFNNLNLRKVCLEVLGDNHVAIKIYESLGFSLEGTLKNQIYSRGAYCDLLIMSVFKEEYKA